MTISFGDVYSIMSGQDDTIMSYGGSKRGGGCKIACSYFFSHMADRRDLKNFVNVRVARMGGSSYFSELWWIHNGEGCDIIGAHYSS
jgi:hypothetical protein